MNRYFKDDIKSRDFWLVQPLNIIALLKSVFLLVATTYISASVVGIVASGLASSNKEVSLIVWAFMMVLGVVCFSIVFACLLQLITDRWDKIKVNAMVACVIIAMMFGVGMVNGGTTDAMFVLYLLKSAAFVVGMYLLMFIKWVYVKFVPETSIVTINTTKTRQHIRYTLVDKSSEEVTDDTETTWWAHKGDSDLPETNQCDYVTGDRPIYGPETYNNEFETTVAAPTYGPQPYDEHTPLVRYSDKDDEMV